MKKLNVGVIGLGRLGYLYAADIANQIPSANLIAVADVDAEKAEKCATDFNVPHWYSEPSDLFSDKTIDAVIIVTPTRTHPDIVDMAAGHGKAIFCEKPIAVTIEDALRVERIIEKSAVFFQLKSAKVRGL